MKRSKTWVLVLLMSLVIIVLVVLILFRGINQNKVVGNVDLQNGIEKPPIIGVSIDALVIERWKKDVEILRARCKDLGYEVQLTNAFENAQRQEEQIRELVDMGAKGIFIIAYDKDALGPALSYAKKKGVEVIAYDRLINSTLIDAYVSFDNVMVGEYMASYLVEKVPEGKYIIINGSPLDYNSTLFNEGYYKVLQPYIDNGSITIVKETWSKDWRESFAYDVVKSYLQAGSEVDAIIGANDLLAEGIIRALSEYGLNDKVSVVGHDAEISACQRIVEGQQLMTVYKPLRALAEGAGDVMHRLITDQPVRYDSYVTIEEQHIPYIKFQVYPVDCNNMKETVIKDRFHLEEDIYRDRSN